jgi:hypothetical protein
MQKRLMARIFRRFRPHLTTDCLIAFLDEELDHKQWKHAVSHIYESPSCAPLQNLWCFTSCSWGKRGVSEDG